MSKSDTAAGQLAAVAAAGLTIEPPAAVTLPSEARPFWDAITRTRSPHLWTEPDLIHAAELARTQATIEKLNAELAEEGFTLINDRGTTVANPKHSILETLTRRSIALSRFLQIHSLATNGASKQQKGKNTAHQDARQALSIADDDDLIARPKH